MSSVNRERLLVGLLLGLALPFPSSTRYAPVARGFYAFFFEQAGDVPHGAVLVLLGSLFYLVVYAALVYGLLTAGVRLMRRARS
jgi:hypothetical protein